MLTRQARINFFNQNEPQTLWVGTASLCIQGVELSPFLLHFGSVRGGLAREGLRK